VRSRTSDDLRGRCRRCYLPDRICPCATLTPIPTRTEVVILRHAREAWKSTNSARWAALALERCSLVDVDGEDDLPLEKLRGAALLLPGGRPVEEVRPERLIVLDGTWSQVRRMSTHRVALRGLPTVSLSSVGPVEPLRLRARPAPAHLSTFEAIAEALRALEGDAVGDAVAGVHRLFIERVLSTRGVIGVSTR
jgi:DTW domain-containing protein YfiP